MRIDFIKDLIGYEALKDFSKEEGLEYKDHHDGIRTVLRIVYDLKRLVENQTSALIEILKAREHDVTRSAEDALWISKPEPITISFDVANLHERPYFLKREQEIAKVEHVYAPAPKGIFKFLGETKYDQTIYRVIPKFRISGKAIFQNPNANPGGIIEVLSSKGFQGYATPTRKEIEEAYNLGWEHGKNSQPPKRTQVRDVDDDYIGIPTEIIAFGAGAVIGHMLSD